MCIKRATNRINAPTLIEKPHTNSKCTHKMRDMETAKKEKKKWMKSPFRLIVFTHSGKQTAFSSLRFYSTLWNMDIFIWPQIKMAEAIKNKTWCTSFGDDFVDFGFFFDYYSPIHWPSLPNTKGFYRWFKTICQQKNSNRIVHLSGWMRGQVSAHRFSKNFIQLFPGKECSRMVHPASPSVFRFFISNLAMNEVWMTIGSSFAPLGV